MFVGAILTTLTLAIQQARVNLPATGVSIDQPHVLRFVVIDVDDPCGKLFELVSLWAAFVPL